MSNHIAMPQKSAKGIEGFTHRVVRGEFFNPDVRRGKKDGKRAPDAWLFSVQAIEAEEHKLRDDARSTIKQKQAEAHAHLDHFGNRLQQNREAQEQLKNDHRMPPEMVAEARYSSAVRDLVIAAFLTLLDIAGVLYIAKMIFGGNILLVSPIGILMTAGVVFGVKTLLEHLSPEKRVIVGKILMYVGGALIAAGLLGLALLRAVTFDFALSGNETMNIQQISIGNLLLMLGLGIGLPLILGVFYESESEKMKEAKIALDLYREERSIQKAHTEWTAFSQRLLEMNDNFDTITANIILLRQNRYIRGFIKGVRKDPNAKQHIDEILKRGRTVSQERTLTVETVGTGRN